MNSKLSYIKQSEKYIIGVMVLATSLSSYSFGGAPKEDKALGQSLGQSTGQVLNKDNNGYYQIGSSADLREFANLANGEDPKAKGKLTSDIEFNTGSVTENGRLKEGHENFEKWTPIGTKEKPFEGELISENGIKKITGLYIDCDENYQGLFGCVGKGGKISNIKVDGSYIRGKDYVGVVAGWNNGTISDSITGSGCIVEGNNSVGGNIGRNWGIIRSCENSGEVKGKGARVGGNVGYNFLGTIGSCENKGEVEGKENVGGNVGRNWGIIGSCENSGEVKGSGVFVGGNVGYNFFGRIKSCENSGAVTGEKNVGGNVGFNDKGRIKSCKNSRKVEGKEDVGGNVGFNDKGRIESCENSGAVTGEKNVGGNIGNSEDIILQGEFINDGVVKGKKNIGMNIGRYIESRISYCLGGNGKLYEIKVNAQGEEELEQKNSNRCLIGCTDDLEGK